MKKQGFTLVELLAVIVILGLIALVSVPAITGIIKNSKEELSASQIETIKMAAKNWASDIKNVNKLPQEENKEVCIYFATLQDKGYLPLDLKNPKTGKPYTDTKKSNKPYVNIKRSGKKLIYEINETNTAEGICE